MTFFQEFRTETRLLFVVALAAIILAVGGILLLQTIQPTQTSTPQEPRISSGVAQVDAEDQVCETDIDCERVETHCNDCSCGAAVNRDSVQKYNDLYGETCRNYRGAVCEFYCETPFPRCVNNRCVLSAEKGPFSDTSNWQTYRNDEFGFEVKYPEGWKTLWSLGMGSAGLSVNPPNKEGIFSTSNISLSWGYEINGEKINEITEEDIEETLEKFKAVVDNFQQENIVINDVSAVRARGLNNEEILVGTKNVIILFIHKDILYTISYSSINGDYEREFNQILSTFRFID